jgi:lysozyme
MLPSPPEPPQTVPPGCADLVRQFEGLRLTAYRPTPEDVPTIGYGHTGRDVHADAVITLAEAEHLLAHDLEITGMAVSRLVKTPVTDGQRIALISFAFNLGVEALATSTLLRKLNAADIAGAAAEFPRWDHQAGKVLPGLTRRRAAEQALFLGRPLS